MEPTPAPAPAPKPRTEVTWCAWHLSEPARLACAACATPICADCATRLEEHAETADAVVCPPCAPRYVVRSSVPWDDPAEPYGRAWWRTIAKLMGHPERFFSAFPLNGVLPALGFAFLCQVPISVVSLGCALGQTWGIQAFVGTFNAEAVQPEEGMPNDYVINLVTSVGFLLLLPVLVGLKALLLFFPTRLLGGRATFAQAFRIACYLTPLGLLAAIPVVGGLAQYGWEIYLVWLAARRVFGLSSGRAVVVALAPILIACMVGITAAVVVAAVALWLAAQAANAPPAPGVPVTPPAIPAPAVPGGG